MSELHWIDEYTEDDQARIMAHLSSKHTTREVSPGVWEHTFTPERTINLDELIRSESTASTNTLTAADINALLERMHDHEPYMPYPMPEMADASVFCMTRSMAHKIRVLQAKAQRYVRARKRTRRQRRAVQRRHNRGLQ